MTRTRLESLAYTLLLAVIFLTPFAMIYTLNSDGANHSEVASAMVHLWRGDCPVVTKWWQFNPLIVPNWTGYLVMAALIVTGASVLFAEKFLMALCLIGPVWAFRFLAKRLWPDNWRTVSWLGFLLSVNTLVLDSGTYSFGLSLGVFLCGLAYYWEWHSHAKPRKLYILTLLATLAWFTHLFAFLALLLVIGTHELWCWGLKRFAWRHLVSRLILVLPFVPGVALTLWYALHVPAATVSLHVENAYTWKSMGLIVLQFISWTVAIPARGFISGEQLLAIGIFFGCLTFWTYFYFFKGREYKKSSFAVIAALLFIILMIVVPFSEGVHFGGWYVGHRFSTLAYMLLLVVTGYALPRQQVIFAFCCMGAVLVPLFILYTHVTVTNEYMRTVQKFMPPQVLENNTTYGLLVTEKVMRRDGNEKACFAQFPMVQVARLFQQPQCSVNRSNFMGVYPTFPLLFKEENPDQPDVNYEYILAMPHHDKITCSPRLVLGDYVFTSNSNNETCKRVKSYFKSTSKEKLFDKPLCEGIRVGVYKMKK